MNWELKGTRRNQPRRRNISSQSNPPVRQDNTVISESGPATIVENELTQINIPISHDAAVQPQVVHITPYNPALWPKLYSRAKTYAAYSIDSIVLTYIPVAGTQNNGTIYIGFTSDISKTTSEVYNPTEIMALPLKANDSISKSFSLSIPPSKMNKSGKDLLLRASSEAQLNGSDSLSLFYAGQLFITTSKVSSGVTDIGTIRVSYRVRLSIPQMDTSIESAQAVVDDGALDFISTGDILFTKLDDFEFLASSPLGIELLCLSSNGDTPVLEVNGQVLAPSATFGGVGNTVRVYHVSRPQQARFEFTTSAGIIGLLLHKARATPSTFWDQGQA